MQGQLKRAAGAVRLARCLRGKMRRDALDILHHGGRIAENVAVNVLQNVAGGQAGSPHVTRYVSLMWPLPCGRQSQDLAAKLELLCDSFGIESNCS